MSLPIISFIIYDGAGVSYLMNSKITPIHFNPRFKIERIPNDFSPRHYYIWVKFYWAKYLHVFISVFANFNKLTLPSEYEVMTIKDWTQRYAYLTAYKDSFNSLLIAIYRALKFNFSWNGKANSTSALKRYEPALTSPVSSVLSQSSEKPFIQSPLQTLAHQEKHRSHHCSISV